MLAACKVLLIIKIMPGYTIKPTKNHVLAHSVMFVTEFNDMYWFNYGCIISIILFGVPSSIVF